MELDCIEAHLLKFHVKPCIVTKAPCVIRFLGTTFVESQSQLLQGCGNLYAYVAISENQTNTINAHTITDDDLYFKPEQSYSCTTRIIRNKKGERWFNIIKGVYHSLLNHGYKLSGCDITLECTIPFNIGLAAVPAIAIACAFAFKELFLLDIADSTLVQCAFLAEQQFMGFSKAKVWDYMTIMLGKKDSLFLYAHKNIKYRIVPIDMSCHKLYLVNSKVPLFSSREEASTRQVISSLIERGMKEHKVNSLSSLRPSEVDFYFPSSGSDVKRYISHIVSELFFLDEGVRLISNGDYNAFYSIVNKSQASLSHFYGLSCAEIDWLIKRGFEIKGVKAARIVGKGLGGAVLFVTNTIDIIEDEIIENLRDDYEKYFGYSPTINKIFIEDGASSAFNAIKRGGG